MDYQFELSEQAGQPTLAVRTRTAVGNLPQELGKAYSSIIAYLNELGEQPAAAAYAAYYNMDMEDLDVEMGFTVAQAIPGKDDIQAGEIPAGRQVSYLYKGAYQDMAPVYEAINRWIAEKGYEPTGICYEFYYNSPLEVPENELLTKIVFPVK